MFSIGLNSDIDSKFFFFLSGLPPVFTPFVYHCWAALGKSSRQGSSRVLGASGLGSGRSGAEGMSEGGE